jgi:hypothetical protein
MRNSFCRCGEMSKHLNRIDVQAVYRRRYLAGISTGNRNWCAYGRGIRLHANRNLSVRAERKPVIVVISRRAAGRQGRLQLDLQAS